MQNMKKLTLVASAAFLMAVCAASAFADQIYNDNDNAANSTSMTTTTVDSNGMVQTDTTMASVGIDYRVLADQDLNYFEIRRAHAFGMTDEQIAEAAKLSHYSWVPMSRILNQIEDGRTIADLCMTYGVSVDTVLNASDWQDRIHNYMDAYRSSGEGELRHGRAHETVASYTNTMTAPSAGTTISTPSGTTVTTTPSGATVTSPNGATVTTTPNGSMVTTPDTTTVTTPGSTTVTTPNGTTTVTPSGTSSTTGQ